MKKRLFSLSILLSLCGCAKELVYDTIIDEVMVLVLKAPNTYTREDTIEIDCHGGVLVLKKVS